VLDRWAALVQAFGPHLQLTRYPAIVTETPARVQAAEDVLGRANQVIDAAAQYSSEVVAACVLAFQSLAATFEEESKAAEQSAQLGPILGAPPDDFEQARSIFARDLATR
jgi:hypothetical protein